MRWVILAAVVVVLMKPSAAFPVVGCVDSAKLLIQCHLEGPASVGIHDPENETYVPPDLNMIPPYHKCIDLVGQLWNQCDGWNTLLLQWPEFAGATNEPTVIVEKYVLATGFWSRDNCVAQLNWLSGCIRNANAENLTFNHVCYHNNLGRMCAAWYQPAAVALYGPLLDTGSDVYWQLRSLFEGGDIWDASFCTNSVKRIRHCMQSYGGLPAYWENGTMLQTWDWSQLQYTPCCKLAPLTRTMCGYSNLTEAVAVESQLFSNVAPPTPAYTGAPHTATMTYLNAFGNAIMNQINMCGPYSMTSTSLECGNVIQGFHIHNDMLISRVCTPAILNRIGACVPVSVNNATYFIASYSVPYGLISRDECVSPV